MPLTLARSGKRRTAIFYLVVSGRSRATTRYNNTNAIFHKRVLGIRSAGLRTGLSAAASGH